MKINKKKKRAFRRRTAVRVPEWLRSRSSWSRTATNPSSWNVARRPVAVCEAVPAVQPDRAASPQKLAKLESTRRPSSCRTSSRPSNSSPGIASDFSAAGAVISSCIFFPIYIYGQRARIRITRERY